MEKSLRKISKIVFILILVTGMLFSYGTANVAAEDELPAETQEPVNETEPENGNAATSSEQNVIVDPDTVETEPAEEKQTVIDELQETNQTEETQSEEPGIGSAVSEDEEVVKIDSSESEQEEPAVNTKPMMRIMQAQATAVHTSVTYNLDNNDLSWVDASASTLLIEQDSNSQLADVNSVTQVPAYAKFEFNLVYKNGDTPLYDNDVIQFTLPEWIGSLTEISGDITYDSESVGSWNYNATDRTINISYKEEALTTRGRKNITGTMKISGLVNTAATTGQTNTISLKILGIGKDAVPVVQRAVQVHNIDIYKAAGTTTYRNDNGDNEVDQQQYKITVYAGKLIENSDQPDTSVQNNNEDLTNVTIDDAFKIEEKHKYDNNVTWYDVTEKYSTAEWITYDNLQATVYDASGIADLNRTVVKTGSSSSSVPYSAQFKLQKTDGSSASLKPGEKIVFTYDAVISDSFYSQDPLGKDSEDENTNSGDETNASEAGSNRSWLHRRISNTAKVNATAGATSLQETSSLTNPRGNDHLVTANKTWLWTNGDPKGNYRSEYKIAVNESPRLNITDWTLEDDLSSYNQEIVSDIEIRYGGWGGDPVAILTLNDLKTGTNLLKEGVGDFTGSTINKIVFKFATDHNYDFTFTAKYTGTDVSAYNEVTSKNKAVLKNNDSTNQKTYGVYESHTTRAATVTKRLLDDQVDIVNGTIGWQTTIDAGIGAEDGSVYRDFSGWNLNGTESDVLNNTEDKNTHYFDENTMSLEVLFDNDPDDDIPATILINGTHYEVTHPNLSELKENANNNPYGSDRLTETKFSDCFQITFKRELSGQILIRYKTKADFKNAENGESFWNKFRYWKNPTTFTNPISGNPATGSASYGYGSNGTVGEACLTNDGSANIWWSTTVNEKRYSTAKLEVRNQIDGDFALTKDSFAFTEAWKKDNVGGNTFQEYVDAWNTAWENNSGVTVDDNVTTVNGTLDENRSFNVSYDSSEKMLKVLLVGDINRKMVRYQYQTTAPLSDLIELNNGTKTRLSYTGSASVYSDETSTNALETASASASVSQKILTKNDPDYASPYATYTLDMNPGELKLSDSGSVILKDNWTENRMVLLPGSFNIQNQSDNENSYQLSVDDDNHGFELTLADNTHYQVTYKVYIIGNSGDLELSNNAQLLADENELVRVTNTKTQTLSTPSGSVKFQNQITIEKKDADDYTKNLAGAVFEICPITVDDQGIVTEKRTSIGSVTTGEDGFARTLDQLTSIETSQVYGIYETKAPKGYNLPDNPDRPIAMFAFTDGNDNIDPVACADKGITVLYNNVIDLVFTAFDTKKPFTRTITGKVWIDENKDSIADTDEKLLSSIKVTLMKDGSIVQETKTDENGFYRFEHLDAGTYQIKFDDKRTVTKKSDMAGANLSFADTDHTISDIVLPDDDALENGQLDGYPGTFEAETAEYTLADQNMGLIEEETNADRDTKGRIENSGSTDSGAKTADKTDKSNKKTVPVTSVITVLKNGLIPGFILSILALGGIFILLLRKRANE